MAPTSDYSRVPSTRYYYVFIRFCRSNMRVSLTAIVSRGPVDIKTISFVRFYLNPSIINSSLYFYSLSRPFRFDVTYRSRTTLVETVRGKFIILPPHPPHPRNTMDKIKKNAKIYAQRPRKDFKWIVYEYIFIEILLDTYIFFFFHPISKIISP